MLKLLVTMSHVPGSAEILCSRKQKQKPWFFPAVSSCSFSVHATNVYIHRALGVVNETMPFLQSGEKKPRYPLNIILGGPHTWRGLALRRRRKSLYLKGIHPQCPDRWAHWVVTERSTQSGINSLRIMNYAQCKMLLHSSFEWRAREQYLLIYCR
jgi:hypothetical protein